MRRAVIDEARFVQRRYEYAWVTSPLRGSGDGAVRPFTDIAVWRLFRDESPQQLEMSDYLRYRRVQAGSEIERFRVVESFH